MLMENFMESWWKTSLFFENCKKCLNIFERVEMLQKNEIGSSFPLLPCEPPVSAKENPNENRLPFSAHQK